MNRDSPVQLAGFLSAVGIVIVSFVFWDWDWQTVAAVAAALVLLRLALEDKRDILAICGIGVVWILTIQVGLVQFSLFEQVRSLMDRNIDPVELLLSVDLWGPRYLISYPAIWISDRWQLDIDSAFTIFGGGLLAFETFFLAKLAKTALGPLRYPADTVWSVMVFSIWVIGLATAMNGRLAAAHLGIAIVLYSQVQAIDSESLGVKTWLQHSVGLFLTMMTSGTAMVGFAQIATTPLILRRHRSNHFMRKLFVVLPTASVLLIALPIVRSGIEKNLEYWGGGAASMVAMLEHGWGEVLNTVPVVGVFVIAAGLAYARFSLSQFRRNPRLLPLLLNIPVGIVCGMYGYSTLTMALPGAAVLLVVLATEHWRFRTLDRPGLQINANHVFLGK